MTLALLLPFGAAAAEPARRRARSGCVKCMLTRGSLPETYKMRNEIKERG